jgi:predicted RND superfamily exporter protein
MPHSPARRGDRCGQDRHHRSRVQGSGEGSGDRARRKPPGLWRDQHRHQPAHTVARIQIPLPGSGTDSTSTNALLTLRNQLLPQTVGKVPEATYAVTGERAASYDGNQAMKSSLPIVFGFVLTFAFLLLLASFRSVVIAAKSVVLNLR